MYFSPADIQFQIQSQSFDRLRRRNNKKPFLELIHRYWAGTRWSKRHGQRPDARSNYDDSISVLLNVGKREGSLFQQLALRVVPRIVRARKFSDPERTSTFDVRYASRV